LSAHELHTSAVEVFRSTIAWAYPPAFWEDYEHLKKGNASGLATAVKFVETKAREEKVRRRCIPD
jgi:hypothetical protein